MIITRRGGIAPALIVLAAGAACGARAQTATETAPQSQLTTNFSARSRHVVIINDLEPKEVRLTVDGVPQTIDEFLTPRQAAPLTIGVLFDVSGSMKGFQLADPRKVFQSLFEAVLTPGSQGFVAAFSDSTQPIGRLSDDPNYLAAMAAAETLKPHGQTAMFDSIDWACTHALVNQPGRRALLLITDGGDDASHLSVEKVQRELRVLHVAVYAIYVRSPDNRELTPEEAEGPAWLIKLASASGGTATQMTPRGDITPAITLIAESLRHAYTIRFTPIPPRSDGRLHHLRIKISRPGSFVFAPDGYYAPKN